MDFVTKVLMMHRLLFLYKHLVYRVIVYLARAAEHKFVCGVSYSSTASFALQRFAKVVGLNPFKPELSIFFTLYFHYCLSSVHNHDDHSHSLFIEHHLLH